MVLAPAMNNHMYEHPATRANVQTLRERGVKIVEPGVGRLASKGEEGVGRLAEPAQLLGACEAALPAAKGGAALPRRRLKRGLKVLVTAGGTREPIDSVRFLGNSSSGRMGLALAQAARDAGCRSRWWRPTWRSSAARGVTCREVPSAAELEAACEGSSGCDVLLMAAAVADFTPRRGATDDQRSPSARLELELLETDLPDVFAGLAPRGQTLVGFAAEHGDAR